MAKPTGSPKTGGRLKGTPNKKSQFLSDAFEAQGIDVAQEIVRHYKESPFDFDKLQILYKIMDYCYPKKKAIECPAEENQREDKSTLLYDYSALSPQEIEPLERLMAKLQPR